LNRKNNSDRINIGIPKQFVKLVISMESFDVGSKSAQHKPRVNFLHWSDGLELAEQSNRDCQWLTLELAVAEYPLPSRIGSRLRISALYLHAVCSSKQQAWVSLELTEVAAQSSASMLAWAREHKHPWWRALRRSGQVGPACDLSQASSRPDDVNLVAFCIAHMQTVRALWARDSCNKEGSRSACDAESVAQRERFKHHSEEDEGHVYTHQLINQSIYLFSLL